MPHATGPVPSACWPHVLVVVAYCKQLCATASVCALAGTFLHLYMSTFRSQCTAIASHAVHAVLLFVCTACVPKSIFHVLCGLPAVLCCADAAWLAAAACCCCQVDLDRMTDQQVDLLLRLLELRRNETTPHVDGEDMQARLLMPRKLDSRPHFTHTDQG